MNTDFFKLIALLLVVGMFSGCQKPIESSKIVGSYVAHKEEGVFNLELRRNHTFNHNFKRNDGKQFNSHGTWEVESTKDSFLPSYETRIVLKGALSLNVDLKKSTTIVETTVLDTSIVDAGNGSIVIIDDPDVSSHNYYKI